MRKLLLSTCLLVAMSGCADREDAAQPATTDVAVAPAPAAAQPVAAAKEMTTFSQSFTLNGETFLVEGRVADGKNAVVITPSGLRLSNEPFSREIDGTIEGAEIADLDVDSHPEVYVYVASAGSERYGSLVAVASDDGKRVSEIAIPSLRDDSKHNAGYRGGDEFAVVESVLARRFPLHDDSGEAIGTMRQLQYKLVKGNGGWRLEVDQAVEF